MNTELPAVDASRLSQASIGKNVRIRATHFTGVGKFEIDDNVVIEAKNVFLGDNAKIERDVTVRGLGVTCENFSIGDESLVAFGNQILTPSFEMGDYSQLHNNGLTSGYKPIKIGHNCWIGQGSILNCTERLSIGNNVRIGTGSQLWTHVASGEVLEGCTLLGFSPLVLEDNVWIVGGAVISPGLVLKRNSIVMTGSVLTKSTEAFHTYAGVPAKDITDKLKCWKDASLDWKFEYSQSVVEEFCRDLKIDRSQIDLFLDQEGLEKLRGFKVPNLVILKSGKLDELDRRFPETSIFELGSKTYLKRRNTIEKAFIKFCVGYRARFLPFQSEAE